MRSSLSVTNVVGMIRCIWHVGQVWVLITLVLAFYIPIVVIFILIKFSMSQKLVKACFQFIDLHEITTYF